MCEIGPATPRSRSKSTHIVFSQSQPYPPSDPLPLLSSNGIDCILVNLLVLVFDFGLGLGIASGVLAFCACFESFSTSPFPDLCGASKESNVVSGLARNCTSRVRGLRARGEESEDDGGSEVDASGEM